MKNCNNHERKNSLYPDIRTFIIEIVITSLHVPPSWFTLVKLPPEFQLVNFLRLYQIIKMMREHHPMRYNRMTEIIKAVAQGLFESYDMIYIP